MTTRFITRPHIVRKADRTLRDLPDDWWRALHAIADKGEPKVRKAFLSAIKAFVDSIEFEAIETALASGNVDAVMRAIPWEKFDRALLTLDKPLGTVLERAGKHALRNLPEPPKPRAALPTTPVAPVDVGNFNIANTRAANWMRSYGAQRITLIGNESREAIRNIIARSFEEGLTPAQAAKQIRAHIGLSARQSSALERFRSKLVADGMPEKQVDARVRSMSNRMIRQRAMDIARTETIDASVGGQQMAWNDAVRNGYLDATAFEREWVAVMPSDGRTCELCAAMDGKKAKLDGGTYDDGSMGPTLHPKCRCTERLVPIEGEQRQSR